MVALETVRNMISTQTGSNITTGTFTSPVITTPTLTLADTSPTADGGIGFDRTNENLSVGDSSASQIIHMGVWAAFMPTWTGVTYGAGGVRTGAYCLIGKTAFVRATFIFGTGSAITGRTAVNNMPFASKMGVMGYGWILDANVGFYPTIAYVESSICYCDPLTSGGTYVSHAYSSSTIPMTWVSTDMIGFNVTYEIA